MKKKYKIFIISGEESGDILGASLMESLTSVIDVSFCGIGGAKMREQGLKSLFPMQDISLMGFLEIIPHLFKLINRIKQTVNEVLKTKPDILITIDSPGFNFIVAKKIRKQNKDIKLIHYVAPTVWAYKEKRSKKIAKIYDHLLVLLPFEPPYFIKEGLKTTFVGHHLAYYKKHDGNEFRKKYNLEKKDFILCAAPGSRKGEILRIFPEFIMSINLFIQKVPNAIIVIPTFKHLKEIIEVQVKNINTKNIIISYKDSERLTLIAASNIALTKCGTITNEFAASKVPMISAYKVNFLTAFLVKRMLKIPHVCLVNILAKKEIIPEFLQEKAEGKILFEALYELYQDKKLQKKQITESQKAIMKMQNSEKLLPSKKAAQVIVDLLK